MGFEHFRVTVLPCADVVEHPELSERAVFHPDKVDKETAPQLGHVDNGDRGRDRPRAW